jgi:hypothetical protein
MRSALAPADLPARYVRRCPPVPVAIVTPAGDDRKLAHLAQTTHVSRVREADSREGQETSSITSGGNNTQSLDSANNICPRGETLLLGSLVERGVTVYRAGQQHDEMVDR